MYNGSSIDGRCKRFTTELQLNVTERRASAKSRGGDQLGVSKEWRGLRSSCSLASVGEGGREEARKASWSMHGRGFGCHAIDSGKPSKGDGATLGRGVTDSSGHSKSRSAFLMFSPGRCSLSEMH